MRITNRIGIIRMSLFLAFLPLMAGCGALGSRPPLTQSGITVFRLQLVAEALTKLVHDGADIGEYRCLDEALSAVARRALLTPAECKGFTVDAWGRPFRWLRQWANGETVVRVTSDGLDGLTQWGEGDDLYLEIRVSGQAMAISYKPDLRK